MSLRQAIQYALEAGPIECFAQARLERLTLPALFELLPLKP